MENTVFLVEIFWMTNSKAFILSQYPQALMTEYAGGEPYMYPEIVAGILQTFSEYWMRITTNGLLLTEYDIHLLKTHGKACLGISLEYFCSYSHAANAAYEMHEFERLTAELSARLWRSYNGPVYMMTDEAGWQYIRKSGLENVYDGVFPVLEWRNYGINTYKYWASGKIQALMRIQAPCTLIFGGFFT